MKFDGDDYPADLVKAMFMKLDGEHIRFMLDCMRENLPYQSAVSS